jgi:uncharacterized protein YndB with AHSA1/START domain
MTGMVSEAIVLDYDLRCDVARAFDVYVGSAGTWWTASYTPEPGTFERFTIGPGAGAPVVFSHRGSEDFVIGQVTVWEPPHRLAHTWALAQTAEHPSEISVTFTPAGEATHFHFEHGGWNDGNAQFREKFGDWPLILAAFVTLAESG